MCYHTALTKEKKVVSDYLSTPFIDEDKYEPFFCLNGFTHSSIYILPQDDPQKIHSAKWGLIPQYRLGDPEEFYGNGFNTLNARSEGIFASKTYRNHVGKRCLIFSDGFYEPHYYDKQLKKQQPYFCYIPDSEQKDGRKLFCFAGLYSKDKNENYYVTQLTTKANEFFMKVHNKAKRMPLVLDDNYLRDWLRKDLEEKAIQDLMGMGFTHRRFDAYPVRNIYKRGIEINSPETLQPTEPLKENLLIE